MRRCGPAIRYLASGFNPRTRMGCDDMPTRTVKGLVWFQSTHPHGVRLFVVTHTILPFWFQSTHPHGVRQMAYGIFLTTSAFQSTHPHGVRHKAAVMRLPGSMFQSTHPHGVRHAVTYAGEVYCNVSIHAPAWGATSVQGVGKAGRAFQSTHPHGVRRSPRHCRHNRPCFNPRTRMGCDVFLPSHNRCVVVSIHAPAWGATTKRIEQQLARVVSIHAPAWGATQNIV